MGSPHSVSDISTMLAERAEALCCELLPAGHKVGQEWRAGDVYGAAGDSLGVRLAGAKAGRWSDFANGDRHRGDLLDLIQVNRDLDTAGAIRWAKGWLGLGDEPAKTRSKKRANGNASGNGKAGKMPVNIMSAPPDTHPELGRPAFAHEYTDAAGKTVMFCYRFDLGDGKTFRPLSWHGNKWEWKDPEGPLPLYRLADLDAHRDKPVLLVEGEKTCEVAADLLLDFVMTTWPHGAKAIKRVDWSPLKGRNVTFWRDNDPAGEEAVPKAIDALKLVQASAIGIVRVPADLPEKWDLGDPLPKDWTDQTVRDLISEAERILIERPRLRPIPFDEITLTTERRYLIKGLIPREGLVVIWGPPKCGKSFWTFDAAMHIARGQKYRGKRIVQGPVVYCACEGQHGFRARIEAFRRYHHLDERPPFYLVPARLCLTTDAPELVGQIRAALGDNAPVAIVIDTLNRSLEGSESSDEDMTAYVNAADMVRETFDCAVLVVHHCGVEGTRPRGHTSLTGAVDAQLAVRRDAAGNVVVTVEYLKDGEEGEQAHSRLEQVDLGTDDDGEPITSCVIVPADPSARPSSALKLSKNQETMLTILREAGPAGLAAEEWNDRAREAGLGAKRRGDLYDHRTALKQKGRIHELEGRWVVIQE